MNFQKAITILSEVHRMSAAIASNKAFQQAQDTVYSAVAPLCNGTLSREWLFATYLYDSDTPESLAAKWNRTHKAPKAKREVWVGDLKRYLDRW